jgi:hypothetical protein
VPAPHDPLDTVDRGAGSQQGDLVGLRRRVGVGVERDRRTGSLGNPAQVLAAVHARELLARRFARRDDFPALAPPLAGDDVHHLGTFRAFGVAGRRLVFGEPFG